jgi:alanyl-tRNA synthetase
MKTAEIRRTFLDFFEGRGHRIVPSASVVPENDPTLFFVNAGMVPFKDVFTGVEKRDYVRATSVQKCMRVSGKHNDLENVGFTARHHTLFEMLGNFSFGDYFKKEAIDAAWEFLTVVLGLPEERLLVTVFDDDDESERLWIERGVPKARIGRCGVKDNFWSMGPTGPCGPCSEIHWDLIDDFVPDDEPDPFGFGHDAGRYMEIWNLVFMQYERYEEDGQIKQRDLPRPSVDTGLGLERLTAIAGGHKSNWEIDEFQSLIGAAAGLAGVRYGDDDETDVALRVIADHGRAAAFLVCDGVMPSNEGRGYVLRRIIRRAIRYGVKLGVDRPFLHLVAGAVIELMSPAYPALANRREFIGKVVLNEESTFRETLDRGLALLDTALTDETVGGNTLSGQTAFVLHDTFGFPPDLTGVIAAERGWDVDMDGYAAHMEQQRARSRAAWKGTGQATVDATWLELEFETRFVGHHAIRATSAIDTLVVGGEQVEAATVGDEVDLVVGCTPFYAEAGGQVGDTGVITTETARIRVTGCTVPTGGVVVHHGVVELGSVQVGDAVELVVDEVRRADITRNHTATHLLHSALRGLLGTHVQQKGSAVHPDRLRFDFSHFEAIPTELLEQVEDAINGQVLADVEVQTEVTTMDEAVARGAMALFGEKYGDDVRLVEVPGFSAELCGGTHVGSTGAIGLFKIVHEGGIAAGVRRIEAISGRAALDWVRTLQRNDVALGEQLKVRGAEAVERVGRLLDETKALRREIETLKQKLVAGGTGGGPQARTVAGVQVLAVAVEGAGGKELRGHADLLLERLGSGVVVLGSHADGKVSLLAKVSKDLVDRVKAGDLVRELAPIVGGRGGGRPEMAQAGGRDADKLPEALERSFSLIEAALGG